jgi:hypothetical protein
MSWLKRLLGFWAITEAIAVYAFVSSCCRHSLKQTREAHKLSMGSSNPFTACHFNKLAFGY